MDFSMVEIIELITDLYLPLSGYWAEEITTNTKAKQFLKAGFLSLDEEHKDKYKINDKGRNFLHPHIESISLDFIKFMKSKQKSCSTDEIVNWFKTTYELKDINTAEEISEYICHNLPTYGYTAVSFYSRKTGNGYSIEETN